MSVHKTIGVVPSSVSSSSLGRMCLFTETLPWKPATRSRFSTADYHVQLQCLQLSEAGN